MENLTEREKKIVEAVSKAVTENLRPVCELSKPGNCHSVFWIGEKKHYNQHQRIDRLLDMLDDTAGVFRKVAVTFVCGFFMAALLAGIIFQLKGK